MLINAYVLKLHCHVYANAALRFDCQINSLRQVYNDMV